jgi:RNA polymerase sigma-70 factor (ECF subfamily)
MGEPLAASFEMHRARLRALAYRMLGSLVDADDAVQETWLRLARADTGEIDNLGGWLTTVTARVCLDMLRTRKGRREDPLDVHVPDPIVTPIDADPEEHAVVADAVGLALLVVLDTLSPTERLAFVLHDVFAVPFEQIASVLHRSPAAAKQLASRARGRLRGAETSARPDPVRQQQIVEAFLAAAREGSFDRLLAVLDPDVVLRADAGDGPLGPSQLLRGAAAVARQAQHYRHLAGHARPVLVNGTPGLLVASSGRPVAVMAVSIRGELITEINILADPDRLAHLDLSGVVTAAEPGVLEASTTTTGRQARA